MLLEQEGKSEAKEREDRKVGKKEGAQHSGTVRGLGGIKGCKERVRNVKQKPLALLFFWCSHVFH